MALASESWVRERVAEAAARLVCVCIQAVRSSDFNAKIWFARAAHDEVHILHQSRARLSELDPHGVAPANSLADLLASTRVPLAESDTEFFAALDAWCDIALPSTSRLYDEPTHRLWDAIRLARTRQREEGRALARPAVARLPTASFDHARAALMAIKTPGRPPELRVGGGRVVTGLGSAIEYRALLQQNFVNLEIPTIELCCALIVEEPTMPLDFARDMARQAWDEARHAEMFRMRLEAIGGSLMEFPASLDLWRMCLGQEAAVKLAIHQCHGEWIGVDGADWFRSKARDAATRELFDTIWHDEIGHVQIGHRWLAHLCPTEERRTYVRARAASLRAASGRAVDGPLPFPFDEAACRIGGFTEAEIETLRTRYARHGHLADAATQ